MAEIDDLRAENETLKQQLTEVKKGPDWRNLERERDESRTNEAKYKGLFETAREKLVSSTVQVAGFTPNDEGIFDGVAGLLVKEFTNGLGEEDLPDASAFVELATRYDVKPAAAAGAAAEGGASDLAARLAAAQAGGDALSQIGQPLRPAANDLDAQIRAAEAAGDVQASMSLKAQKLRALAS